ncbi:aminomethyl-transferring glycine dehydrogenase [Rubritalea profundi]|uniref:Glycine dehydrogenase (decarboxylating) n=1 Tax=Rubritalea profundi TaxID=1658618 RepID=A0A2S7U6Q8_9BACT|nr:aminomethyl-transferring glycine dehydrogenase [Rubritalea profundi]PQJ30064.1 glycine dehydrogenase (aminomethyl-transferring) [Rubritalea profundi]
MSVYTDFCSRHVGVHGETRQQMIESLGYERIVDLIADAVPAEIREEKEMDLPAALSESDALDLLNMLMDQNEVVKSFIGQGYYGTKVPAVIQRNVLENPGWYTAYTPYQSEIAQGRLEALLNFQTLITDLTGLDLANSSLLDEATAAAEAVALARSTKPKGTTVFVSDKVFPQTIDVVKNRCEPLDLKVIVGDWKSFDPSSCDGLFATIVQYPDADGSVEDYTAFHESVHAAKATTIVAADILALTVLTAPGEFGTDIAVGSSQRFGVPLGFGGPHAGYIACIDKLKRKLPGRIIGVSIDQQGNKGYRLALQTREQHIRRDKATSNICTAQVLLAVMASMYAVYHGPDGLRNIAYNVHYMAQAFASSICANGYELVNESFFDTLTINTPGKAEDLHEQALAAGYNLRRIDADHVGIAFDETTVTDDVVTLLAIFGVEEPVLPGEDEVAWDEVNERTSDFCTAEVFHSYRSETEMLRYLARLEKRDLALNESMIALGSCTMKLNATSEMIPLSWPTVSNMHPFAPEDQTHGYLDMLDSLSDWLAEITGFAAVSLQPNAGSQGEYAGLLAIRRYHHANDDKQRIDCLIPTSAHGTNPASSVMAGFKVIPVKCDEQGNIDVADLKAKAEKSGENLGCLMVTYPSTHGVYESTIKEICQIIHDNGGQVYMDGANMNAQVGLTSPGAIGADVCHLNLHKTFCIPHGGGGPGVGPIGVAEQLVPYLPGHVGEENKVGAVSAAAYGSASINVISWMYIAMMGSEGLTEATKIAILNANYVAKRLNEFYPVLYTGNKGLVAHECIIDLRPLSADSGITVEDVSKRLMDYGYHSPTMSFPVTGTLMIEPTESESKQELDRFCDALINIHGEIQEVIDGTADKENNVLKLAPHTAQIVISDAWDRPYSREKAAYPVDSLRSHKFWPYIGRIDNVYGDRNLVCSCAGMEEYGDA